LKKKNNKIPLIICCASIVVAFVALAVHHFISKSILSDFKTVNEQLEQTNKQFDAPSKMLSDSAAAFYNTNNSGLVEDYERVMASYTVLKKEIRQLKDTLISICAANKDEYDKSGNYMIEQGHAALLKEHIQEYITLQNNIRKKIKHEEKNTDYTDAANENGVKVEWETYNFFHVPLAAAITNLTVVEADTQNQLYELKRELETNRK
jgi:hypothetical protein